MWRIANKNRARVGKQTVSDWKKNRKKIENFCGKMLSKNSFGYGSMLKKKLNFG